MANKLKLKLPKRIGGVKIPKAIRKGPVANFVNSRTGQIVIAEAAVVALGALAVARTSPDSAVGRMVRNPLAAAKRASRSVAHAGVEAKATAGEYSTRVSNALREAAHTFRTAMERDEGVTVDTDTVEIEPVAKKRAPRKASRRRFRTDTARGIA